MPKGNRKQILERLAQLRALKGHINLAANDREHAQLGRWIAQQRYKRRNGMLTDDQIAELDALGMVWEPTAKAWDRMLEELVAFKTAQGHCNVPEQWTENPRLANWVHNQRHRFRTGHLDKTRKARLDAIGFSWSIYKAGEQDVRQAPARTPGEVPAGSFDGPHRLYRIRDGFYVQHGSGLDMPSEIVSYRRANGGADPPYIPLPAGPVTFSTRDVYGRERPVTWSGMGLLPAEIMRYVTENGCLPRTELR